MVVWYRCPGKCGANGHRVQKGQAILHQDFSFPCHKHKSGESVDLAFGRQIYIHVTGILQSIKIWHEPCMFGHSDTVAIGAININLLSKNIQKSGKRGSGIQDIMRSQMDIFSCNKIRNAHPNHG
jgi:hypothetical protein